MKKYSCLIIDDEEPARSLVREYLKDFIEFEIIGEANNGFEGVQLINELKPDIIFLDIQMPKLTGFEVLELLEVNPKIIFSTAFDQYAIQAFEKNAIDYLLKPYSKERFGQAIQKISKQANEAGDAKELSNKISESSKAPDELLNRIAIRIGTQIKVIPVDEISYFESDDDYVRIHTKGSEYLKEKTMKFFESHLDPVQFIRIHRSYILNVVELDRLERYEKDSYIAILKDGSKLKVSSNGYKALRNNLNF
jgi:two-component system, LytTR family, response regulator